MNVKTIALTGAEMAVSIGGSHAEVKNNGTDMIYASANSNIVAGADGVVSIPAGAAVTVLDTRGEVCLLGTGSVEVVGKDFVSQVFKSAASSGGGGTEDEVARNAINAHAGNAEIHVTARDKEKWNMGVGFVTFNSHVSDSNIHTTAEEKAAWNAKADLSDIPTELPANGGNAMTANHQIQHYLSNGTDVLEFACSDYCPSNVNTKIRIMNCPTCPTNYGYDGADNDFWYDIYKLDSKYITIKAYDIRTNFEYTKSCLDGNWSDWIRCHDGGNAYTLGGKSAADFVQKSGDTMQGAFRMGLNQLWFGDIIYMQANGDTLYICDNTGNVIGTASKQGFISKNSEMLENHTAADFVMKSEYKTLAERVAALEGK